MKKTILTIVLILSLNLVFGQRSNPIKSTNIKGTVIFYRETQGFGYIRTDEGNEIYIKYTELFIDRKFISLFEGQRVLINIKDTHEGPVVSKITIL